MRIAFITFEYPPGNLGGAGVYAQRLTEELAKAGIDVHVFTPSTQEDGLTELNGVKVHKVKTSKVLRFIAPQFWFRTPAAIQKVHKKQPFDILHINDASYSFLPARIIDVPHVVTIHHLVKDTEATFKSYGMDKGSISSETSKIVQGIQKRAIRSVDKVIAVSKYTKEKILEYYPVPKEKISVVYNGMDWSNKIPGDHARAIRKKLKISDNEKFLLFVGRIDDPRKGLTFLLVAMTKIKKDLPCKLIIVGSGDKKSLM
jgi:glycosyltransferase involved in cell wall biosynthesis